MKKHATNFIDLTGKKFNYFTVLKFTKTEKNRTYWLCKCKCGKEKEVEAYRLKSGGSKSCGCLKKKITAERNTRLLTTHGMTNTRFYRIWQQMRNRCQNPKNQAYGWYGKKGISVNPSWNKFENFRDDMLTAYNNHIDKHGEKDTTIDRINGEGNYCKENCRWATYKVQANNIKYDSEARSRAGKLGAKIRWGK